MEREGAVRRSVAGVHCATWLQQRCVGACMDAPT